MAIIGNCPKCNFDYMVDYQFVVCMCRRMDKLEKALRDIRDDRTFYDPLVQIEEMRKTASEALEE